MSDPRYKYTVGRWLFFIAWTAFCGGCIWLLSSCATCPPPRPCPAPEIVTVDRIVPAPCPVPPEVTPMTPIIEQIDCETAPTAECVRALMSLLGDVIRERDEYRDIVRAYAMGPVLPPQPVPPSPTPP